MDNQDNTFDEIFNRQWDSQKQHEHSRYEHVNDGFNFYKDDAFMIMEQLYFKQLKERLK